MTFDNAADFQSKLAGIVNSGSGSNTLTYTGPNATLALTGTVVVPGSAKSLDINLAETLVIGKTAGAEVTLGNGTTLNILTGEPFLEIGGDEHGVLNVAGGVVNLSSAGKNAAIGLAFGSGSGELKITNGGVVNMGMGDGAIYSQLFTGYYGAGNITMDNGRINIGSAGASMRLGIYGSTTLDMSNGSVIDSSRGGSHFWVGDRATGSATVNVNDSSSIIIKNDPGHERYMLIGSVGGTGVINQNGADSLVHFSNLDLIGIGQGNGAHGTYNLNAGRLEIGTEGSADSFRVGVSFGGAENESTALFNINGGTADIKGNLEIANAGKDGKRPTATVTLNAGLVDVGGKLVFGPGTGTLNLNGGVLEVGGTNAITGSGSIYFAGGTLRAGSDFTASHAATLNAGGATFDTNGFSMAYSGVLSGTGSFTKTGTGTLSLSGNNSYSGDTTVRGGTLETKHANALGTGGNIILDGGTLKLSTLVDLSGGLTTGAGGGTVDLASNEVTLGGASIGSGGLTFTKGTVTLAGDLNGSGETVLGADATLKTSGDNQLSANSLVRVESGASLTNNGFDQAVAGLAGSGIIQHSDGTFAIGGTNASSTFAGTLGGTGTFEKTGTGKLTLTGDSDTSGDFRVNGGTLVLNGSLANAQVQVGQNGILGGNGSVGVLSGNSSSPGGTVAPGNSIGTLHVVKDVNFDLLTYEAEIDTAGNADLISAGEWAYLAGGKLDVKAQVGLYDPSTMFKIVAAVGGIEGEFDVVTDNLAFFDASVTYGDNDVWLQMLRNSLTLSDVGETPNQIATAKALEELGDSSAIGAVLLTMELDQVREAYDALSGEIHASTKTALIKDARHIREAANDRLRAPLTPDTSAVWGRTFGALGATSGDGNAAGLTQSVGGLVAGVDGDLDAWRLGALLGYGQSNFAVDGRNSTGSADSYHAGVYGGTEWGGLSFRTGAAYSFSDIETERTIDLTGLTDALAARYGAHTVQAFGEFGYTIDNGALAFEPFVNLAHVRVGNDAFAETGGDAALAGEATISSTTFATIGLRASGDFELGETKVTARGSAAWRHALGDNPTATNAFDDAGFTVSGPPVAKDAFAVEAGLDIALSEAAKLNLSYSGQLASETSSHAGRVGLAVKF